MRRDHSDHWPASFPGTPFWQMEFDHEPTIAKSCSSIEDEKTLARALGTENSQKEEDNAETRTPELNFQLDMYFFALWRLMLIEHPSIYRSKVLSGKRVPKRPICPNRVSQIIALHTLYSRGSCATCSPLKLQPFDPGILSGWFRMATAQLSDRKPKVIRGRVGFLVVSCMDSITGFSW